MMQSKPNESNARRAIEGRDRAYGPFICPDCGEEHGSNLDCAECRREAAACREAMEKYTR